MTGPGDRLAETPLADDLSFLIARFNAKAVPAADRALAAHGLRVRSYAVLGLACSGARPTQREIADFIALDPSQLVALIDDLEARGYVQRTPEPTDRRSNVLVSTEAGDAAYAAAKASVEVVGQELLGDLDATERLRLVDDLRRVMYGR